MRIHIAHIATFCSLISLGCGPRVEEIVDDLIEGHHGHPRPDDPVPDNSPYQVLDGGYVLSGEWAGNAWTAADEASTIQPEGFDDLEAGQPLCASGTVAAAENWSGYAILGFNVNQDRETGEVGHWNVTSEGLRYELTNLGGTPLRIDLTAASGSLYCLWLQSDSGTVPWSDFRTDCWDEGGMVFDGSDPLETIGVVVPGNDMSALSYDLCIGKLEPTDDITPEPVVCGESTGTGFGELAAGFDVAPGGYVTSGDAHGSAFIYASTESGNGTSVAPSDFTGHPGEAPLCISGVLGASPEYADAAMLGVYLNQAEGEAEPGVLLPTTDGIAYDVTNCADSPLRLEINGADGEAYADARWCAPITGGQGFVPWSEFNTQCWDNMGLFYDGTTPLQTAFIMVPSAANSETPFDFCLNGLTLANE